MPLTLEQYATYLDSRADLPWPAAPQPSPVKARPHLVRLDGIRAVLWNVYGTLLAIPLGELVFEHPTAFIENRELFGDLADAPRFVDAYLTALRSLHEHGARRTLERLSRVSP